MPGEPVLELAVRLDREQVRRGHQDHQPEGQHPERRIDPAGEQLRSGDRLEPDDDDPEVPVQPADGEARPAAEGLAGVVRERARRRVGRGHLAQHPHHHDDEHAGDRVGEEGGGADLIDHRAGADEQAGPDDTPDRDHRQVALFQALVQFRVRRIRHDGLLRRRDRAGLPYVTDAAGGESGSGELVRVGVADGRVEGLLDRPGARPALDVEHRAGLVVGARRPAAAEGLAGDDRAGGPVVDVEVARGVPQRAVGLLDRGPVRREDGAGQRVRAGAVDEVEGRGVVRRRRRRARRGSGRSTRWRTPRRPGRCRPARSGSTNQPSLSSVPPPARISSEGTCLARSSARRCRSKARASMTAPPKLVRSVTSP